MRDDRRSGANYSRARHEDHRNRHLRGGRRLARLDVRGRAHGRGRDRLRRMLRPAHAVQRGGHRTRAGVSADRQRPAAGRRPLLGPVPPGAAEPRRGGRQGDRRHRAGAVGHQGQDPRGSGIRAVRRAAARPPARLLVALRHLPGAQPRIDRRASAALVAGRGGARQGGGAAGLHRAQDQHHLSRRSRPRAPSRLRWRPRQHRRDGGSRADRSPQNPDRHPARRGRTLTSTSPST